MLLIGGFVEGLRSSIELLISLPIPLIVILDYIGVEFEGINFNSFD